MFGGKLVRIGAVVSVAIGTSLVSAIPGGGPAGAVPEGSISSWATPGEIPVSGTSTITLNMAPYNNGVSAVSIDLSGGLVVASPSNASFVGSDNPPFEMCTGTITATPGTQSVTATATNDSSAPPGATSCEYSFNVTSDAPGSGVVQASAHQTVGFSIYSWGSNPLDLPVSGPPVTGLSPAAGPGGGGTKVTVIGSGFTGATAVDFGATPATHVKVAKGGHSLTAVAPPGAGTEDVTVTTPADGPGVPQSADTFTYLAPTITSITPSSGRTTGGKKVTIKGADLQGASVMVGSTLAPGVKVNKSGTSLKTVVPIGSVGPATVTVTTPAGSAITSYTYTP
jgi:hypothetical protein